jgi:metal-sulfur cluster biosynthetic enzyme
MSAVKENVNPVVHQVQEKRSRGGRKPLGWSHLERLCFSPQQEDDFPFARTQDWGVNHTAEDRAIFHALTDVAAANPRNVSLLRKAGLNIPSSIGNALRSPNFAPDRPIERKVDMTTSNRDEIDCEEVFDIIRNIQDPEHPLTLEQLNVVNRLHIQVHDGFGGNKRGHNMTLSTVDVCFTPTIPHCSMATLIGLSIRVKLLRSLPSRFKITVRIQPGTHASEDTVNKQLADKERVCAALENKHLLGLVNRCIENGMKSQP